MASREELQAKRERALKLQAAVSKKISRHRTQKGVELAGTKHDVRVPREKVKRLNGKQLDAHIARQEAFVSRSTQFVAGAKIRGETAILPVHGTFGVAATMKRQAQLNKVKAERFNTISGIRLPSNDMTIGQQVEAFIPKHPTMTPPSSYPPHLPVIRTVKGITSEKALKQIAKEYDPEKYFKKKLNNQWKAARKMVYGRSGVRNKELTAEFKDLNAEEFNLLWNYTRFAEVNASEYVTRQKMLHDKKTLAYHDQTQMTNTRQAKKYLAEVKALNLGDRAERNAIAKGKASELGS